MWHTNEGISKLFFVPNSKSSFCLKTQKWKVPGYASKEMERSAFYVIQEAFVMPKSGTLAVTRLPVSRASRMPAPPHSTLPSEQSAKSVIPGQPQQPNHKALISPPPPLCSLTWKITWGGKMYRAGCLQALSTPYCSAFCFVLCLMRFYNEYVILNFFLKFLLKYSCFTMC